MPVYFARAGKGPVKIGYAKSDTEKRVKDLQTGCPEDLVIIHVEEGSLSKESYFHKLFFQSKIRGEWFHYEPEISIYLGHLNHDDKYYLLKHRMVNYPYIPSPTQSDTRRHIDMDLELSWRRGPKELNLFIEDVKNSDIFRWGTPLSEEEKEHLIAKRRRANASQSR
jgi:hypothetical protein